MNKYDFSGWATRNDLLCADGRTIRKDAFKDNDGQIVPLVFGHQHNDVNAVLGHALLENRDEGIYAYGTFNDTESGQAAKKLVQHGDVTSLSIYANKLKQVGGNVVHGVIRELSLVLAGANPGAYIETVMAHSEDGAEDAIETLEASWDERIVLYHSDESKKKEKEDSSMVDETKKTPAADEGGEETVADVFNSLSEKQKTVVYAMIGQALEEAGVETDEEGDDDMKHNVFDTDNDQQENVLSHSDQQAILNIAKQNSCGSLQDAISIYAEENGHLSHGIDEIETLFPDYQDITKMPPEVLQRDQGWVSTVMSKAHKSPISRIRTRYADIRDESLNAHGYQKGKMKTLSGNIKLFKRTTDPQTVYRKDVLNRDDIIDITDFDVVEYQYGVMKQNLNEELAKAIMIGDGRDDGDADKIDETHIRSIWHDDDVYTIHADVDFAGMEKALQGTETDKHFGKNYIAAEAMIQAALYTRENYKGSGNVDFYCTPHTLNVMLLARDFNGRRIYSSKADLVAALNVGNIYTVEQFQGKTRKVMVSGSEKTKQLIGIFVNMSDYTIGSTKGGEITRFNQFDIDFNQEKYLIETRLSGALTRPYSAIALEEDVTSGSSYLS